MAGERGTNTQPSCTVTIEIATYEEERVGMSVHLRKDGVNFHHMSEQEVAML